MAAVVVAAAARRRAAGEAGQAGPERSVPPGVGRREAARRGLHRWLLERCGPARPLCGVPVGPGRAGPGGPVSPRPSLAGQTLQPPAGSYRR